MLLYTVEEYEDEIAQMFVIHEEKRFYLSEINSHNVKVVHLYTRNPSLIYLRPPQLYREPTS